MLGNVCRLAKESRGWHIKYSGTCKFGQAPFIRGSGWEDRGCAEGGIVESALETRL
jgi:hypothetical protein